MVAQRALLVEAVREDVLLQGLLGHRDPAGEPGVALADAAEVAAEPDEPDGVRQEVVAVDGRDLEVARQEPAVRVQARHQHGPARVGHPAGRQDRVRADQVHRPQRHLHRHGPVDRAAEGVRAHPVGQVVLEGGERGSVALHGRALGERHEMAEARELPRHLHVARPAAVGHVQAAVEGRRPGRGPSGRPRATAGAARG